MKLTDQEQKVLQDIMKKCGLERPPHSLSKEENARRFRAYDKALLEAMDRNSPQVRVFRTAEAIEANTPLPTRAYPDDAGFDLRLLACHSVTVAPQERVMIPTGVGFEIPSGWWGHIRSRSSMGKRGLIPAAQVVDSNFTGPLALCLVNTSSEPVVLEPQERVAQIVFVPCWMGSLREIQQDDVKSTDRGSGAFGSSGRH